MSNRCVFIMAGGTGGHIFPGIAVADTLAAQGWRVVWLANPDGMEARLVPARGYDMAWLRFGGVRGKGLLRKLLLPLDLLRAFWIALRHLRRERPDVVLGMGGYLSFPGGMMASLLGRPLVIHEQNSVAGMANRTLARLADQVLTGFPHALADASWIGNPVRAEIAELPAPTERYAARNGRLHLLVIGGSLGARVLNDCVPRALALLPAAQRPLVTHQAGETQIDALREAYAAAGVEGKLLPFIDDMAAAYAGADLVICRAGALTIAELACAGVASLLVPYPHAVDDHQTGNAGFLADQHAAFLLPQTQLDPERLASILSGLDRPRLREMAEAARALAKPQAAADVAARCAELAESRSPK